MDGQVEDHPQDAAEDLGDAIADEFSEGEVAQEEVADRNDRVEVAARHLGADGIEG